MAGLTAARRAAITVRWRNIVAGNWVLESAGELLTDGVVLFDDREAERASGINHVMYNFLIILRIA